MQRYRRIPHNAFQRLKGPNYKYPRHARYFGFMDEIKKGFQDPVYKEFAEKTAEKAQAVADKTRQAKEYAEQKAADAKVSERLSEAQKKAQEAAEKAKSLSENEYVQKAASPLSRVGSVFRGAVDRLRSAAAGTAKPPAEGAEGAEAAAGEQGDGRMAEFQRKANERLESLGATATSGAKRSFDFFSQQAQSANARVQAARGAKKSSEDPPPSASAGQQAAASDPDPEDTEPLPQLTWDPPSGQHFQRDRQPPTDALVLYERELDWYEMHARQMMSRFERTKYYKTMQKQLAKFKRTRMFKRLRSTTDSFSDRVAGYQDQWDTTQNPIIWKVRDMSDKLTMESDFAHAVKAIRQTWPDFWPEDFLDEFETDIAPKAIKKFLQGDNEWLSECCEGEAEQFLFANFKERETLGHVLDDTILWVDKPWVDDALTGLVEKTPILTLHIQTQHLNLIRDEEGEIVEGNENSIANAHFVFSMTPAPELEDVVGFPWKFVRFHTSRVHALV